MTKQYNSINVVHIYPYYLPVDVNSRPETIERKGGGERYVFNLAKTMSKTLNTKLILFGSDRISTKIENLNIEVFPSLRPLRFINGCNNPIANPLALLKELGMADIIHLHQCYADLTLLAAILAKINNIKVFLTDYGWNGATIARFINPIKFVDGLLAISNFYYCSYSQNVKLFEVIYGGVDVNTFHPTNITKEKRVLFVGRILPHKGINYLIEALDDKTELHIIGIEQDTKYLEDLRQASKNKNVKFIFNLDGKELVHEYSSASVLVLPSVYEDMYGKFYPKPELFGLVLIEAMACETPVIGTTVGSIPEVIEDGVNGYLVKPNDPCALRQKIYELLDDPKLVRKMGHDARLNVLSNFTWQKVSQRCIKSYTAVLNAR